MHRLGDFDDLALEQAAGVRIGQHDRGDVRPERRAHRRRADGSVGARRHRAHGKADQRGGRRVGAVRGIRDQHDVAAGALAVRRDRRLDRHHAAEFAMRARLRRHRDRAHAGHLHQQAREHADRAPARPAPSRPAAADARRRSRAGARFFRSAGDYASSCRSRAGRARRRSNNCCATAGRSGGSSPARSGPAGRSARRAHVRRADRRRAPAGRYRPRSHPAGRSRRSAPPRCRGRDCR